MTWIALQVRTLIWFLLFTCFPLSLFARACEKARGDILLEVLSGTNIYSSGNKRLPCKRSLGVLCDHEDLKCIWRSVHIYIYIFCIYRAGHGAPTRGRRKEQFLHKFSNLINMFSSFWTICKNKIKFILLKLFKIIKYLKKGNQGFIDRRALTLS